MRALQQCLRIVTMGRFVGSPMNIKLKKTKVVRIIIIVVSLFTALLERKRLFWPPEVIVVGRPKKHMMESQSGQAFSVLTYNYYQNKLCTRPFNSYYSRHSLSTG